jgi:hypothetical protein
VLVLLREVNPREWPKNREEERVNAERSSMRSCSESKQKLSPPSSFFFLWTFVCLFVWSSSTLVLLSLHFFISTQTSKPNSVFLFFSFLTKWPTHYNPTISCTKVTFVLKFKCGGYTTIVGYRVQNTKENYLLVRNSLLIQTLTTRKRVVYCISFNTHNSSQWCRWFLWLSSTNKRLNFLVSFWKKQIFTSIETQFHFSSFKSNEFFFWWLVLKLW